MTKRSKKAKQVSQDDIKKLVANWGGFEKLVAELSATGDVRVEHNVFLKGKSGTVRQIDVVLRHTQGLYEHLIIVECKYWNKRVSRLHVDALITSVSELNASKGVIFSTVGFQSGAIAQASQSGIDLFTVRFPTDREWGFPGRHIDFYVQIIAKSFSNIVALSSLSVGAEGPLNLNLNFDSDGSPLSETPVFRPLLEALYPKTLEAILISFFNQAAQDMWTPKIIGDGSSQKWTRKFWASAECVPRFSVMLRQGQDFALISKINFDIALSVSQVRIIIDRAERFSFVLAVDDHVRNVCKAVSKEKESDIATISILGASEVDKSKGPPLVNGSIMTLWTGLLFPFDEVKELARGEFHDLADG